MPLIKLGKGDALIMIRFEGVTKSYDKNTNIEINDMVINKGEIFGFLGPNGAGKTTTIKMLVGLLKLSSGTIKVNNFDISLQPKEAKKMFAYIPDNPNLYEKLTAREFVKFVANLYGMKDCKELDEKIQNLLAKVELAAKADNLIETYSHGMKQKAQIAAALIHSPEILILDEPFVGLDPAGVKIVKNILKEYAENGKTVFISTHILDVVENLCTKIAVIQKGKIKYIGSVDELKSIEDNETLEDSFLNLVKSDV